MDKPEITTERYGPDEHSQSKIKRWKTCPKMYYYNDVKRVRLGRDPCGMSLPMGTVFHSACESFHNSLMKGFEPNIEIIMHMIDKELRENCANMEAPPNLDNARVLVVDGSLGYHWQQVPRGTPISEVEGVLERAAKNIQWWFQCYVDAYNNGELDCLKNIEIGCEVDYRRKLDDLGMTIRGQVDVAVSNTVLADWKTANANKRYNWSQDRAEGELQASYYAALMNEDEIDFLYVVVDKQVHPDYQSNYAINKNGGEHVRCAVNVYKTKRTKADHQNIYDLLELFIRSTDVLNGHKNGKFPRVANGLGEDFCGNFCDFKTICYNELMEERGINLVEMAGEMNDGAGEEGQ